MNECQLHANWVPIGGSIVYCVPQARTSFVEHLGGIKKRSDGRWDWWRYDSIEHKWRVGRGVADTKAWAQIEVLRGWDDTNDD